MILDTVYLVRLFGGKPNAYKKARDLESRNVIQRVPSPVFTEIEYGAAFQADDEERRRIRNVSRMYSVSSPRVNSWACQWDSRVSRPRLESPTPALFEE